MSDPNINDDAIIDWDGEISNEGQEFAVLPDGDTVELEVTEVERGHNAKDGAPQVKVTFRAVSVAGHGATTIRDYIKMTRKSEWKLCELFGALGLRQHGETLRLRWDLVGLTARATVLIDKYTGKDGDEKVSNKIKKYLEPAAGADGADADFG